MREILFRGKRIDNGEFVYGYVGVFKGITQIFVPFTEEEEKENEGHFLSAIGGLWHTVHTETVGQFTGLTDKNGKKVFEGDIGRYKQTDGAKRNGKPIICTGFVIYNAKTASYAVESKDEVGCEYFDYFPIKDFEVIGNIHDNPELLEGDSL